MHCKCGFQSGECLLLMCGVCGFMSVLAVYALSDLLYMQFQTCCTVRCACTFRLAVQCTVQALSDMMHTCWYAELHIHFSQFLHNSSVLQLVLIGKHTCLLCLARRGTCT